MFDALDPASGDSVTAERARRRVVYLCPVCRVPVFLRKGGLRRSHFAHRSGEGAETCDRFVSLWTTRPSSAGGRSSPDQTDSLQLAELCFGIIEGAPEFSIAFPAYGNADVQGSILIDAKDFYQEIPNIALEQGKTVAVPFAKAPWTLVKKGSIDMDYWAALQAARVTLDSPTIVFHANRSNGRRVRASEALAAGQSFWIITSRLGPLMADKPAEVQVVDTIECKEWAALGLTLPDVIDMEFLSKCEGWLNHPIVPAKSFAWVDWPLPSFTSSGGNFVFRLSDEPIIVRASKNCVLQILDADTDVVASQAVGALEMVWQPSTPGRYMLLCDGRVCESFQMTRDVVHDTCFLIGVLDDGLEMPLNGIQTQLTTDDKGAARPTFLKLKATHPRVSTLVKINGQTSKELIDSGECTMELSKSLSIEADALGSLVWHPLPASSSKLLNPRARELGRWLLGVTSMNHAGGDVRLSPEIWKRLPTELAAMCWSRWPITLRPQVMNFERLLRDVYELA
jgi:hypothetical protein